MKLEELFENIFTLLFLQSYRVIQSASPQRN